MKPRYNDYHGDRPMVCWPSYWSAVTANNNRATGHRWLAPATIAIIVLGAALVLLANI